MSGNNRIDQLASPSPTGKALLPPKSVPWLMLGVALAEVLALTLPQHTLGAKIAHGVVAFAALLGLASPGLRK